MTLRRARGDGGLHWDEQRQRWIATATVGYDGRGKRIVRRGAGRTKTEAKSKLKQIVQDHEDGFAQVRNDHTVAEAINDWLTYGLGHQSDSTIIKYQHLCRLYIVPNLGARRLRDLTAREVDVWLRLLAPRLSTDVLRRTHACLNRAVRRAMARDLVRRNVVDLAEIPTGRAGRPSKSLTPEQVDAVLSCTAPDRMHSYIVLSLLTGGRTEELRALRWEHVHLDGYPNRVPSLPPYVEVWRSVRAGGDTKTRLSRRTLALPIRCVEVLRQQQADQAADRLEAGEHWTESGLVFTTAFGTMLDPANVRRDFRRALGLVPGIDPAEWTPRELRHSFVSVLSNAGVPLEEISRLVGHAGTTVTELVYRHQLKPVIQTGATVMDRLYASTTTQS